MPTTTYYVDSPSGAGSTDGTSLANAYASAAGIMANRAADTDDLIVELHGTTDTNSSNNGFQMTGMSCASLTWRVMEDTYIWDQGWRFDRVFELSDNYNVTVDGDYSFKIQHSHASATVDMVYHNGTGTLTFERLEILSHAGTGGSGVRGQANGSTTTIKNLLIKVGVPASGVTAQGTGSVVNVYNFTVANCGAHGLSDVSGTLNAYNGYSGANTSNDYNGTFGTKTNCLSSDATGTTTSVAFSTANFVNVTGGTEDLHIIASGALDGVGSSAPAPGDSASTDLDNAAYSDPRSVGCYEVVAVGGDEFFEQWHQIEPGMKTVHGAGMSGVLVE